MFFYSEGKTQSPDTKFDVSFFLDLCYKKIVCVNPKVLKFN